ncbi:MAG: RagB/SusD family nutrient uptake outer membrane protein [Muribaculaceae bacterium]|nr:RagB/SusD family nutrient uptake outer membrane protein [Muribaculaceae bacterium]
MKRQLKYISVSAAVASMLLVSCNDLDTQPMNRYVTSDEKAEAIAKKPDLAAAGVVGISASYNQSMAVYSSAHCDFGWPSVLMFMDCIGPDLVSYNIGYNWFSGAGDYSFGTNNNYLNNLSWYYGYKIIRAANDVLMNIDPETTDPELQLFAAQGYANRAYIYFNLAQLFQYTYKGSENLPCVPLITDENSDAVAAEGCPRATVQEVYDQVLSDLDKAIKNLSECGYGVDHIADAGIKRFISLGAAYGIRARVNLVMNNWQAAADDAAKAISTSGATPFSIAEASQPSFSSTDEHNWIWGVYIQEVDRTVTTGICNWISHMGSLNYGYAQAGAWRRINIALYDHIPDSDCRKGWFLDENCQSNNLNANQMAYVEKYGIPAYAQVKFAPYQNVLGNSTNANDIPLMRVEEMYLIQAEATAMAGNAAGGKEILENFVKTYRNPSYTCTATDAAGVQEAVWFQRRVELFGEGFCYFDLLRLNKGLDRRGGGWDTAWVYDVPAPLKPLLVPNNEMEANTAMGANNETWSKPNAVDDF